MPDSPRDRSIRDDTTRLDTVIPTRLMSRLENVAAFLGLTKRAALLTLLDEGCSLYERRMLDAEQARGYTL